VGVTHIKEFLDLNISWITIDSLKYLGLESTPDTIMYIGIHLLVHSTQQRACVRVLTFGMQ